ncbi:MAG: inorganic diphosphatase [Bryobacteraceae bacterium]
MIEILKNSANKYKYDGKLDVFRLDRTLYSPMHYPGDYGFIPGTLAEDDDPLDVMVLVDEPSFTGCLMDVRPVGLLHMIDESEKDQKVLAVPNRNPRFDSIHTIDQVFPHSLKEIEYFFSLYKELQNENQGLGRSSRSSQDDRRKPRTVPQPTEQSGRIAGRNLTAVSDEAISAATVVESPSAVAKIGRAIILPRVIELR